MKRGVVPRCAARPPEPPAQVHPDHHAEDGAVAVVEHADGAEPVDEEAVLHKRYKNRGFPSIVPKCVVNVDTRWALDANANAGRHDNDLPNDDGVVKWEVSRQRSLWGLAKPAMGSPKP